MTIRCLGVFFEELELKEPDYHLGVGSGSHANQTGEMLKRIEEVLLKERPDWMMVYGDTNRPGPKMDCMIEEVREFVKDRK